MADRQQWAFDPNLNMDARGPRALEYIAHYLDRIDQSLERIAEAMESGKGNEPLRAELRGLTATMSHR